MRYRRFGRTELACPSFPAAACATSLSGRTFRLKEIPAENQANLEATIRRALELGINHIETARGYGTSEMQLGRILPTTAARKIIVQTKIAPIADPEGFLNTFDTR